MNFKKIVLLLIFAIAIMFVIAPANAKIETDLYLRSDMTSNNLVVMFDAYSDIGLNKKNPETAKFRSDRKKELNKVSKIVIQVSGQKTKTFKKPSKGWKVEASQNAENHVFRKNYPIKGSYKQLKNKAFTVKLYNNKNKVLLTEKGRLSY